MVAKGRNNLTAGALIPVLAILAILSVPATAPCGPRFEARWSNNPVRPGKPFSLTVTARWDGETGRYAIRPPRLELPEELAAGPVSSRSYREGGENVVTFRLEMTAPEPEDIPGFPLQFSVFQAGSEEPFEEEISTAPLRVDVPRWKGIPLTTLFLCTALAVILLPLCALWLVKRKKRRGAHTAAQRKKTEGAEDLPALKEELNACKVRGDTRAFFETALKIHERISREETDEIRKIRDWMEQATYGDLRLSGEELEAWHRKLKRLEAPVDPEIMR